MVSLCKDGKAYSKTIHRLVTQAFQKMITIKHVQVILTEINPITISNLRYATNSENGMNKSKHSNNTYGTPGVSFVKTRNKWRAEINKDGKQINLGYLNQKKKQYRQDKQEKEHISKNSQHTIFITSLTQVILLLTIVKLFQYYVN